LGLGEAVRRSARDRIVSLFPMAHRRQALLGTVEGLSNAPD
jgi:hypothetical protein